MVQFSFINLVIFCPIFIFVHFFVLSNFYFCSFFNFVQFVFCSLFSILSNFCLIFDFVRFSVINFQFVHFFFNFCPFCPFCRAWIFDFFQYSIFDLSVFNVVQLSMLSNFDSYFMFLLGMLSDSYVLEVMYSCGGEADCTVEAWFVKVPNCAKAYLLDEMEVFMYSNLLPLLQAFGSNACNVPSQLQLPIPLGENSIIFKEHQRNTNFTNLFSLPLCL